MAVGVAGHTLVTLAEDMRLLKLMLPIHLLKYAA